VLQGTRSPSSFPAFFFSFGVMKRPHAEVGGNAARQQHARLGRAVIGHRLHPRQCDEIIHHRLRLAGRGDEIEILHDFPSPAQAAGGAELKNIFVFAERIADFLRLCPGLGVDIKRGVIAGLRDSGEQLLFGLCAETCEVFHLVRQARRLEFRHVLDAEFFVQHLDLFRTEAGNFHQGEQPFGN
jgi:hypothetical protein